MLSAEALLPDTVHIHLCVRAARRAGRALEARGLPGPAGVFFLPSFPERARALSVSERQNRRSPQARPSRGLPALPSSRCPPCLPSAPLRSAASRPPARFGRGSLPQPRAGALCWRPAGCFPLISRTGRGRPHFLPSHTSLSLDLNPFPPPSLPPCPLPFFPSSRLLQKSYNSPCCGARIAGVGSFPLRASVRAGSRAAGSDGSQGAASRGAGRGEKPPPGAGLGAPTAARLPLRGGPGTRRTGGDSGSSLSSAPSCPGAGSSYGGGIELTERAGEAALRVWGSGVSREGEPDASPLVPARVGRPAGCNVCTLVEKSQSHLDSIGRL